MGRAMVAPTTISEKAWKSNSGEVGKAERNPKGDDLGRAVARSTGSSAISY